MSSEDWRRCQAVPQEREEDTESDEVPEESEQYVVQASKDYQHPPGAKKYQEDQESKLLFPNYIWQ